MDTPGITRERLESMRCRLAGKGISLSQENMNEMIDWVKPEIGYEYLKQVAAQVEKILEIDPLLSEKEILGSVTKAMVEYLGAEAASIRVYDPDKRGMISYGSYPHSNESHEEVISLEDTIAGEVVRTDQCYQVPNISKEERYKNKEMAEKLGVRSMLAVPLYLPRFSKDLGIKGVIQIYYKEEGKCFTPLELKIAEVISKPAGYIITLKRIDELRRLNLMKDKISEHIYKKLAKGEGIKMRDLFNSVVGEVVEVMQIQRCSLFSVSEDRAYLILEAGYPEAGHGIGSVRLVKEERYAQVIVNQTGPFGSSENERVYPHYVLITNPLGSELLPQDIKHFLETQRINSVLYIPLKVDQAVRYILAFDAQGHHQRFTEEEIDLLTFFGKELAKGLELEKLYELLHDFRNPAIAVAGFAKRIRRILAEVYPDSGKVIEALDILLKETSRIQELGLALRERNKESVVDLTEILRRRFLINKESLRERGRRDVQLLEGELVFLLWVRCSPIHLERVIDNLLSNASAAIPEEGGVLSIRSYREGLWAVLEINNTGQIPEEGRDRFLLGEGRGRGLHICNRFVNHMRGFMWAESKEGQTTFRVMLPLLEVGNREG